MAKTCNHSGCVNPVFSHSYCQWHQRDRPDFKKPEAKPRKAIPVRTKKKPLREKIDWGFTSQPDLFADLWEKARNEHGLVVCKYTGTKLNGYESDMSRFLCCFAHILPKKNYPLFRLNPENIRVVSPDFHSLVDQGRISDRARHPEWDFETWDREVIEMKEKYLQFKKMNLLA